MSANSEYRYAFTFNNYSDADYEKMILICKDTNKVKRYIIGKEIGEINGTPHLQGYIEFRDKVLLSQLKKIDKKIHWEKAKGSATDNYMYCCKENEFVSNYTLPPKIKIIETLYKFQEQLLDLTNVEGTGKVIWVYDPVGQTGKTSFVRYMNIKYDVPFSYGGKCTDIINLAFNNAEYLQSTEKPVFIFNFGRSTDITKISYNAIEQLSDGAISNTKYEAQCLVFNKPNIIVMSNELPLSSMLTKSRWITYEIKNNELVLTTEVRHY